MINADPIDLVLDTMKAMMCAYLRKWMTQIYKQKDHKVYVHILLAQMNKINKCKSILTNYLGS